MIYTFDLDLNWKLITSLSEIDRFGGSWTAIETREGASLKQLKSIATVRSVGASTRIEGSKMTDDEVQVLLDNLHLTTLEERDQQEVVGYFEALDTITASFRDIDISESSIKNLHKILLKYSQKDDWHKGNYKQVSNSVEATRVDGSKYVIFETAQIGFETEDAMRNLIAWYESDKETHPIVRSAIFVYDFLSIHPFQDGNGRLSRLLATLLILKNEYSWIQYVSFEHEIEKRKTEYYKVLMNCQQKRPGENVTPWVMFYLSALNNIQQQLLKKLDSKNQDTDLSSRERQILLFIENHPYCQSGEIAERLNIPLPTVKRNLTKMVIAEKLVKSGVGKGTSYSTINTYVTRYDLMMKLTATERKKEFTFPNRHAFIELKKIILVPHFSWKVPEEWSSRMLAHGLSLRIECINSRGAKVENRHSISAYNSPMYFQPVFSIANPIKISSEFWDQAPLSTDYPIKVTVELEGNNFDFDVTVIYDEKTN